jgi:hypothetical protein
MTAFMLREMQGARASYGKVLRPLLCANPTVVFPKRHIEAPMQGMFHPPMLSHGLGKPRRLAGERG